MKLDLVISISSAVIAFFGVIMHVTKSPQIFSLYKEGKYKDDKQLTKYLAVSWTVLSLIVWTFYYLSNYVIDSKYISENTGMIIVIFYGFLFLITIIKTSDFKK